jgi:hypothetical protein
MTQLVSELAERFEAIESIVMATQKTTAMNRQSELSLLALTEGVPLPEEPAEIDLRGKPLTRSAMEEAGKMLLRDPPEHEVDPVANHINEAIWSAAMAESRAVDGIIRQILDYGYEAHEIAYRRWPDFSKPDELLIRETVALRIRRDFRAFTIVTQYQLYPHGRPDGYPELKFEETQNGAKSE